MQFSRKFELGGILIQLSTRHSEGLKRLKCHERSEGVEGHSLGQVLGL